MSKTIDIVVLEWNLENSEFYASDGFDQFILSRQDFHGYFNELDDSESVHPTDIGRLGADFFDYMRKGEEHPGISVKLKRDDGKYFNSDFDAHYIRDNKENIIKGICTISIHTKNLKNKQNEEVYDPLTGLYNRDAFCNLMYERVRKDRDRHYALIQWDMGRFRVFNDMFGYEEGDELLKYMGIKMKEHIGDTGDCSRVFADHFYACIPNEGMNVEHFIEKMKKYLNEYKKDFEIVPYFAIYPITNPNESKQKICNNVRLTMIEAKNNLYSHTAFFNVENRKKTLSEQEILEEMKTALKNKEFVCRLQPKFSLTNGDLNGAEALAVWQHPSKGEILPSDFMQVIEVSGFITTLDRYLWEQVCMKLKEWIDKGYSVYPISINISRVHLYNPQLVDELLKLIRKYTLAPHLLQIELMENYYSIDPDQLVLVTKKLQDNGFSVSVDDFGTGNSSFNMLNHLPVNEIKIDKGFIDSIEKNDQGRKMVKSIVKLAEMVNIPVVAEGVETEKQVEFLRSVRCDYAQGFYFSKPVDFDTYEDLYLKDNYERIVDDSDVFTQADIDEFWSPGMMIDLMYNNIVSSMGIFEYKDDTIKVLRANNGYFRIMGCDLKTFRNDDKNIWNRIIEKDRVNSIQKVSVSIEAKCVITFDFRAVSPDNRISTYTAKILYLAGQKNNFLFYGAFKDVTVEKEIKSKLKVKEEGYRILYENTNVITFDYDVENDRLTYTLKIPDKNFVEKTVDDFLGKRAKLEHIHDDYQDEYMDIFEWARRNVMKGSLDYLANYLGYGYSWCRAFFVSVPDDEGNVYRVVGQAVDIQHEKNEIDFTKHRIERDQMTGVYNKIEARRRIQEHLIGGSAIENDALILIDLDDFKKVNDNYGHIIGDLIIRKIAIVIEKVFSIKDIVGRFGGDEFIVFLKDIPRDILEEKIRTFYEMFELEKENGKIEIGCSMGVSFTSENVMDFDTLIEHADMAMYEAKQKGKNQHIYYDEIK